MTERVGESRIVRYPAEDLNERQQPTAVERGGYPQRGQRFQPEGVREQRPIWGVASSKQ